METDNIELKKHINWIKSHQRINGSFNSRLNASSRLDDTYYAIRALIKINNIRYFNKNKLSNFILFCENPNGGFSNTANHLQRPQFTSYGIYLLKILNYLFDTNIKRHIEWHQRWESMSLRMH